VAGRPSTNVGGVFFVEKINLELNQATPDGIRDINFLADTVLTLNSTGPVKDSMEELFKLPSGGPDYTGAVDKNSQAIKELLRIKIGRTMEDIMQPKTTNSLHTIADPTRNRAPNYENGWDQYTNYRINSNWEWQCEELIRKMAVLSHDSVSHWG
jgi:hypothetical protein